MPRDEYISLSYLLNSIDSFVFCMDYYTLNTNTHTLPSVLAMHTAATGPGASVKDK